jgi:hypothetical protein
VFVNHQQYHPFSHAFLSFFSACTHSRGLPRRRRRRRKETRKERRERERLERLQAADERYRQEQEERDMRQVGLEDVDLEGDETAALKRRDDKLSTSDHDGSYHGDDEEIEGIFRDDYDGRNYKDEEDFDGRNYKDEEDCRYGDEQEEYADGRNYEVKESDNEYDDGDERENASYHSNTPREDTDANSVRSGSRSVKDEHFIEKTRPID